MNIINKLTLRHMKLNKRRTLVTMIGIIISVAMITAVSTVGYSIMDFMARNAMESEGYFHVKFDNYRYGDNEKIVDKFNAENYTLMKTVGDYIYTIEEDGNVTTTPYVYNGESQGDSEDGDTVNAMRVVAVQDNYYDMASIKLLEGHYPVNDSQILLSNAMSYRYEGKSTGDKIVIGNKEYTISGIIENMEYESRSLELPDAWTYPMYTRLDVDTLEKDDIVSGYFYAGGVVEDIEDKAEEMLSELGASGVPKNQLIGEEATWFCSGVEVSYNYSVLMYYGMSRYDNINNMVNILKFILIVIIMIGSISLIANGFIISISERSRHLGMLASIGATKKQKRSSVYFEGFIEGIVGIPLGILVGFVGIDITFRLIDPLVKELSGNDIGMKVIVNGDVILWSVVFSVLTIFLSAYIPAKRASKIAPIDAIRQSKDVKIASDTVKTMGITRKIFGFEGDLALKNLKRNKKRYRVTVFSMFISLTLFLAVYSFVYFIQSGYEAEVVTIGYDIEFGSWHKVQEGTNTDVLSDTFEDITDKLLMAGDIEQSHRFSNITYNLCSSEVIINDDKYYNDDYLSYLDKLEDSIKETGLRLIVMDEDDLKSYLKSIDVDYNDFVADANNIILFDNYRSLDYTNEQRYVYEGSIYSDKLENINYQIIKYENVDDFESDEVVGEKFNIELHVYSSETSLLGINGYPYALITEELAKNLCSQGIVSGYEEYLYIKTDNANDLEKMFKEEVENIEDGEMNFYVNNFTEIVKTMDDALLLVSVFVYGFIILMTLICIANIVNTISTSLALRGREFAMLKSVGMTDRAFRKMIAYESGFYGIKALIFGLPVGTAIMFLIKYIMQDSMSVNLGIPWKGYIIAVVGVFVVIGTTMLYSSRKIRKQNVIDALKNENI